MNAQLILENGTRFSGKLFGSDTDVVGEVVYTTGMVGYQETITDPSYAGQLVTMTYPLIGNYGINLEDMESSEPKLSGFIVREKCDTPSNWRCEMELDAFLKRHGVTGLEGIDTRELTKILRDNGTMRAVITSDMSISDEEAIRKMNAFTNKDAVASVTTKKAYTIEGTGVHVAIIDLGIKNSMIDEFKNRDCKLTVFPAFTSAKEILASGAKSVFVSGGPGSPAYVPEIVSVIKELVGKKPLFGICLGHLLIAEALGCETKSLKAGHRGGHPVKAVKDGHVYITNQNHEFAVSTMPSGVSTTFINVTDGSVEGVRHETLPVSGVQFHPEGSADLGFLFDEFLKQA